MKRRKSKKIDKIHSPVDLHRRIDIWHNMEKGKSVHPSALEPLEPSELTRIQQIQLIEYLKYSEALSNTEIADFLKMHRITVSKRLNEINEQFTMELENKGFTVWQIVAKLKRTCSYVKKQARIKGDGYLYLKAELAFIHECQALGIVFEKPVKEQEINYPVYSESDEKLIIRHLRKIERQALNPASGKGTEREVIETIPEVS